MPEQRVKPRPQLVACCGNNIFLNEIIMGTGSNPTPPVAGEFLLQEDGNYILQEDGFKIKLETSS